MMQNKLKIAIFAIDDDENMLTSLEAYFRRYNIVNYKTYSDPDLLLKELHQGVQICIIDHDLRNENYNGLTLMKEIMNQNPYCRCIVMSGYDDINLIISYTNADVFKYLRKAEKDFAENLISYIKEAIEKISATFEFYTTVLSKMKGVTDELKNVRNGKT
jgi:DNA-binding NtrC family response regulator